MLKLNNKKDCILVAEIGQAHDGSLGVAHSYIDAVAKVGAHAIKFQTHYADEESTILEPWRTKFSFQDKTRFDYWKRMEFTQNQWVELADHAHKKGLYFISSPFSIKAVNVLKKSKLDCWKIASGEIQNYLLIEELLKTKLSLIVSTGMSTLKEIEEIVNFLNKHKADFVLLQCTSSYPVKPEETGLNLIQDFTNLFGVQAGISDHSGNIYNSLAAVTLGAKVVEVHVTFHKDLFGPDTKSSITIEQLKLLVEGIRWIETAMKNPVDKTKIGSKILQYRNIFFKSFVAKKDILIGEKLSVKNLSTKKPLLGIPASDYNIIKGKKAKVFIRKNEFIKFNMIE